MILNIIMIILISRFLVLLVLLVNLIVIGLVWYLSKPYTFEKLTLQSGANYITIIIGGILVTIPSSYLSMVKNFGIGVVWSIQGLAIANLVVYMVTGDVLIHDINRQLQVVFAEADRLFYQLNIFITQFHTFVNETGINVVTNVQGELGIDVLESLDDSTAQQYANRINVFDGLIHNHIHELENIIERMTELEERLSELDENYKSQSSIYKDKLKDMIRTYGHYNDN